MWLKKMLSLTTQPGLQTTTHSDISKPECAKWLTDRECFCFLIKNSTDCSLDSFLIFLLSLGLSTRWDFFSFSSTCFSDNCQVVETFFMVFQKNYSIFNYQTSASMKYICQTYFTVIKKKKIEYLFIFLFNYLLVTVVFWEQKYKLQKNMGYILKIWIGWHPYLLRIDNIVPISLRCL